MKPALLDLAIPTTTFLNAFYSLTIQTSTKRGEKPVEVGRKDRLTGYTSTLRKKKLS